MASLTACPEQNNHFQLIPMEIVNAWTREREAQLKKEWTENARSARSTPVDNHSMSSGPTKLQSKLQDPEWGPQSQWRGCEKGLDCLSLAPPLPTLPANSVTEVTKPRSAGAWLSSIRCKRDWSLQILNLSQWAQSAPLRTVLTSSTPIQIRRMLCESSPVMYSVTQLLNNTFGFWRQRSIGTVMASIYGFSDVLRYVATSSHSANRRLTCVNICFRHLFMRSVS